jgi:nitrogen-specific signal transduction histidine kinase
MFAELGVCIDISAQKSLEAQLLKAQKMESLGTLAGGIAHDFNNILYPIIGYCEMLMDDLTGNEKMQNRVRTIFNSALRASELVKQILAFSRQRKSSKSLVKIQDIVSEIMTLIRHSIPAAITISLEIDERCEPVVADPAQIHQVVMNLITNAYQAMEGAPGWLAIGLHGIDAGPDLTGEPHMKPGRYVDLYVADTGAGIKEEMLDKIFDPFFTTKEVGKGTGLGLAVSYGIIREHGGTIRVESAPGRGSTFHVLLPVRQERKTAESPSPPASAPGGREHILLVDDTTYILDMVRLMLERLGYRVTVNMNSRAALEMVRNNPDGFDLVITDLSMPDMSGDSLAEEIQRIRPGLPIILCTGFGDSFNKEKIGQLGIKACISKPVSRDQLAEVIRKVLDDPG